MALINKPKTAVPGHAGRTIARVFSYMKGSKLQLAIAGIAIVISSSAGVAGNYFLKPIINQVIVPLVGEQNPDLGEFGVIMFYLVLIYLAGVLSSFIYGRLMVIIAAGTLDKIRKDLFVKLQALPVSYFDTHSNGELMGRFTNDADTMRDMLSQSIPQFINSIITGAGTFVMMLLLSPVLTLLVMVMLLVLLRVMRAVSRKSAGYYREQQRNLGRVNGYIEEMMEGSRVVKAFCQEEQIGETFDEMNEELFRAASNAGTASAMIPAVMSNISFFHYALTAIAGSILLLAGRMDIGSVAVFLQYTRTFSQPISLISNQMNAILAALAGAERIFEVIDSQPESDNGEIVLVNAIRPGEGTVEEAMVQTGHWAWKQPFADGTCSYTRLKGDVRFQNISYGYSNGEKVLHNISLHAGQGQKIALVGATGAGKTTIINLLNRFYETDDGRILYDGIDIRNIKKTSLRRSLAMVLQDTHLFTGTVMENIRYGRKEAADEDVIAAARLANAHFFISHLPQGYDTMLTSDGINLSQGQRQLIAIARAAVMNPPVLVLDEATSSIDTRTEALIEQGMNKLMEGRTVFVIAHRLSTVRNADKILVLEDGRIIEQGNHETLLKEHGKYYQLCTGAVELY